MSKEIPMDQALVERCRAGDGRAFAAAVERHLPALLRFARAQCEGELAANEILLRAIERAGRELRSCGEASSALTWLLRAIHQSCSGLRR